MRCDANVSIRKFGDVQLYQRCELKNLSPIRAVHEGIQGEIQRQISILESKNQTTSIFQETYSFDGKKLSLLRSKECEADYRYLPEFDIPPLELKSTEILKIKMDLPRSIIEKRKILVETFLFKDHRQVAKILNTEGAFDYFQAMMVSLGELQDNGSRASNGFQHITKEIPDISKGLQFDFVCKWYGYEYFSMIFSFDIE